MFTISNSAGDEIKRSSEWRTVDDAVEDAKDLLEDDPELQELTVWESDENENFVYHVRTVTWGPDANWDSVVVVLRPGEQIMPPGRVPHRLTEEDLEGYDLGDPKRITLERHLGEWV